MSIQKRKVLYLDSIQLAPLTLGNLINELQFCDQDKYVYLGFGLMVPTHVGSWRGSYDQPSLRYETRRITNHTAVSELLEKLDGAASGALYRGYKGGTYRFTKDQVLWVDNDGDYTETAIFDVVEQEDRVIIQTYHLDFSELPFEGHALGNTITNTTG